MAYSGDLHVQQYEILQSTSRSGTTSNQLNVTRGQRVDLCNSSKESSETIYIHVLLYLFDIVLAFLILLFLLSLYFRELRFTLIPELAAKKLAHLQHTFQQRGAESASTASTPSVSHDYQPETKSIKSWKSFVSSELLRDDWEVIEDDDSNDEHRSEIIRRFELDPTPHTPILLRHSTDTLVALCATGVYGFGIDFDFGFLISDTIDNAVRYITIPGTRQQGPTRRGYEPYDVTGEDNFETCDPSNRAEDNTTSIYYDSGFEDCSDDEEF